MDKRIENLPEKKERGTRRRDDVFEDTLVIVGGIIPDDDRQKLLDQGVAAVFGPGTPIVETIEFIEENARG